ncbi:MAG TPA: POTRA domain-containing protein, partial [Gemmatimonadota bacterium]|nr:POTRA domain-containing protein [Gemmatimonadota bacterium]
MVALSAGPVQAQSAVEEDSPLVEELVFHGVEHVDDDDLREGLFTEATGCKSILLEPFCWITSSGIFVEKHYLDQIELKRDELRTRIFYYHRGYRDARVVSEVRPEGEGVAVTFTI